MCGASRRRRRAPFTVVMASVAPSKTIRPAMSAISCVPIGE
jgi:hypothetical protein